MATARNARLLAQNIEANRSCGGERYLSFDAPRVLALLGGTEERVAPLLPLHLGVLEKLVQGLRVAPVNLVHLVMLLAHLLQRHEPRLGLVGTQRVQVKIPSGHVRVGAVHLRVDFVQSTVSSATTTIHIDSTVFGNLNDNLGETIAPVPDGRRVRSNFGRCIC